MTGITVAAAASRRGMILTSRRHFACLRHCGICMNPTSNGIGLNDNSNYYRSDSSIPLNCYTWSRTNSTTTKSNRKMKKNTNTIDIGSLSNGGGAFSGHVRSDLSGSLSGGSNGSGSGSNHGSKDGRKSKKRSQNNSNNQQNNNHQHSQNSSGSNKVKVIYKSQKDDDAQQQKPKVRGGENMRRKRPNRRSAAVLEDTATAEDDKNNAESPQQQSQHFLQQTGNFGTIKDSSHVPILIPPSNNDDKDFKFNKFKNLPIMNASALLDPEYVKKYSVKGTRSRNGTDAARRLLHAKKDFVNMLRGYIVLQEEHYTNPNLSYNNNKNRNPVCLTGHGVPKALLQDHINMADSLLKFHDEPVGCFFKNTVFMHQIQHAYYDYNNSSSSEQQQQKKKDRPKQPRKTIGFNRMRIVKHNQPTPSSHNNGNNNNKYNTSTWWSWPPKTTTKNTDETTITHPSPQLAQSWERQMELYLTVMDRMITRLSLGLQQYNHNYNNNNHQQHKKPTYYYWTVKIIRGITYPIEYLSDASSSNNNNDYDEPIPLVEWTIPSSSYRTSIVASKSSNKHHRQQHQGHISIRLQGIPDDIYNDDDISDVDAAKKQQQQPVTLLFDAYFGS